MSKIVEIESKEPDRAEIQKQLKLSIIPIYKQITTGCFRNICYNVYCAKNPLCKESKKKII